MATEYRKVTMKYSDLYPQSSTIATDRDKDIEVREYLIPAIDRATGEEKMVPVYMDENDHPFIKADLEDGEERFYPLLGGGAGPIPAMKDGTQSTKKDVIYFDIYNQNGIQEKIYLPFVKEGNDAFIDEFKQVFSATSTAPETTTPRPATDKITRNAANTYFLRTEHPEGDLVFDKRKESDGKIETSYLYIAHKDAADKTDYLRLMTKEGEDRLYINLDNVDKDPTTTPPTKYADGTTFEVRRFFTESNGATPPVEVLKAEVFDGETVRTVELPVTKEQAENSSLYNKDSTPAKFYTPQEIATRDRKNFTEIDEKRLPNCGNKKVDSTKIDPLLTGNFHYEKKDETGIVLQTHRYISYMDASSTEQHLQLIQKDGHLYGNFNTDPSDSSQKETCLIESIADDGTVTYIAGNPGKKYSGKLPIDITSNPDAIQSVRDMIDGRDPSGTSTAIEREKLPKVVHSKVDKVPVAEMGDEGTLKRKDVKARDKVAHIEENHDFESMVGVSGAFSQPILLPDGNKQQLTTFHSDDILATVSEGNTLLAKFVKNGTNCSMVLSEAEAQVLGIDTLGTNNGDGTYTFDDVQVQLSQNGEQEVTLKAGSPDQLGISFTSQGAIARKPDGTVVRHRSSAPLDIGVSDTFYNAAIQNKVPPVLGCSFARDRVTGKIANPTLNFALLESLTRQHRLEVEAKIASGETNPDEILKPMVLADGTELYSVPVQTGTPPKTQYMDYMHTPEKKLYQHVHRTNTAEHGKTGAATVPGYEEISQGAWREEGEKKYFAEILTAAPDKKASGKHNSSALVFEAQDSENQLLTRFFERTIGAPANDEGNVDWEASLIDGEGVAQLARAASADPTYNAVTQLEDAEPDHTTISQINDPEAKDAEGTKDTPRPKPPKEREKEQLWKGIDKDNRKTWIALAAVAVLFSVFIPFLNIIAGVLIGIVAANDSEFLTNIFFERENYHKGLTKLGRQYDRELVKNQSKIREHTANIEKWKTQIKELETSGKTPRQIAIEKAKLEAKIATAQAEKATLIERDHQLAVLIAQDQDLGLRAELKSHAKWEKILAQENARYTTINGLMVSVPTGSPAIALNGFDFKRSDEDLAAYKTQLQVLRKDKANKHVKDILDQQIEFCEMVQLYRRDVRKLSPKENARLTHLSTRFSPTSQPPAREWSERIGKLIDKTGIAPTDRSAAGLETEVNKIFDSLVINPGRSFNQLTNNRSTLYNQIYFSLYGTGSKTSRDGKLLRTIDRIKGCADEAALHAFIASEGEKPHCEDLVKLKYLLNKDKSTLTPDEIAKLNELKKKYPKIANNKNFDLLAELENEQRTREDDLRCMEAARDILNPPPPMVADADYYDKVVQKAAEAKNPKVRAAILKAAKVQKYFELLTLAKTGVLPEEDRELLSKLSKEVEVPNATLQTNPKGAELLRLKELLGKKKSELTSAELSELETLKTKYPKFKKDSNVAESLTDDLLTMSEAAHMQAVSEEIKTITGKDLADLVKDPPDGMTTEEIETLLKDSRFSGALNATKLGMKKVLTDQMEYQEYQYLRELQSKELSKKERNRLEELKRKYGSSKSPISSFLDQSPDYMAEIEEYLRKSDEYIEERKIRAEKSVETVELTESGDGKDIESAIDMGLATYDARDEARMDGGNIQNQDDKNPKVEGATQTDTSEYKGDATDSKDLTDDDKSVTDERKRKRVGNDTKYGTDGRRSDGLGR